MIKIGIILLAAGDSKRFGSNKLLSKINGKTLYEKTIERYRAVSKECEQYLDIKTQTHMLLLTQYEQIRTAVNSKYGDIKVVDNPNPEMGLSHSISLGIQDYEKYNPMDYYLFSVCDQPYLTWDTVLLFLKEFLHSEKGIGCIGYQGNLGNPVVFSRSYARELSHLNGEQGGKVVVNKHIDDLFYYGIDYIKELVDIDYITDIKQKDKTE